MEMKSYLVTGGAGFIGSHICELLLNRGDRVVVLDNFISGKRSNLPERSERLVILDGDIRDIESYAADIGSVEAIIHLAALISGYDSLSDPDAYVEVNVRGLQRVIDFAGRHAVKRIVFASSSTVYGRTATHSISEDVVPSPITVYAASKLIGEHLLRMYAELYGYSYCNLRLFNVYGPRQSTDHPYANVTCKFSHAAANGLPVVKYGDGGQSRDFIYVDDVARAFIAVMTGQTNEVYNVGTGQSSSINDLISRLEQIMGTQLQVEQNDAWPNDVRFVKANIEKFERDFGIRPSVELGEGLSQTVDFFIAEGSNIDLR